MALIDWHIPRNIRQIPTQNTTIHVFIDSRVTFTIVSVHASPAPFPLSLASHRVEDIPCKNYKSTFPLMFFPKE
ncbi:hypothetical protein ACI0CA_10345 [Hominenteromicrobium mulieris]|uniref:hypothetical protein n=1 Tax=Hominenteromicrobium mulieris TaxID=2885357 RepID=UPI003D5A7DBB